MTTTRWLQIILIIFHVLNHSSESCFSRNTVRTTVFLFIFKEMWHYKTHASSSFSIFFPMSLLEVGAVSTEEYIFRHSPKDNLIMIDIHLII